MSPEPERPRGILVLVVGPSGSGKDVLMRGARDRLGAASGIAFARRVVTRPADASEDNEEATPESFTQAERGGAFVLSWEAHGLRYGVPRRVLEDVRDGTVVVVNASRTIMGRARQTLGPVQVALVTAPPAVLEARILARGRDRDAAARLARETGCFDEFTPDIVIDNSGSLDAAVDRFVSFLMRLRHR